MARYNLHPAQGGGHYHNIKTPKDRQITTDEKNRLKQAKRLRKKRRKGGKG